MVSPVACCHEIPNELSITVAVIFQTASGGRTNITTVDTGGPVPNELTPTTEIVYSVPSVSPGMEQVVDVVVQNAPPGVAVAVYVAPISSPTPFDHDTLRTFALTIAVIPVTALGRSGTVEADEASPSPSAFRARTDAVYAIPLVMSSNTHDKVSDGSRVHVLSPGDSVTV